MHSSVGEVFHKNIDWHLLSQGMTVEDFRSFMAVDKKVLDGKLRLILLRGALGSCVVTGDLTLLCLTRHSRPFAIDQCYSTSRILGV